MASKVVLALGLISSVMGYCESAPKLELTNIDYESRHTYASPKNLTSKRAVISFDLSSDGGDLECEGISEAHPTYFDAKKKYECTSDAWGPSPFNATFTFDRPSNVLAIDAIYTCFNVTARTFDTRTATISSKVNLTCDERIYENKNWTAGAGIASAAHTTCDTTWLILAPAAKLLSSKPLFAAPPPKPKSSATPPKVVAAPPKPAITRTTTIIAGATPAPNATEPDFDFDDDEDDEARRRRRQARLRKVTVL